MVKRIVLLFSGLVFFMPMSAYAYLDPGAGSMILQMLLGGLAGVALFGRLFWKKIKMTIFDRKKSDQ
jgi:hypothetical protein